MAEEKVEVIDGKKEKPIHHNKSIHKRVVNGSTMYPKVNTTKQKNPNTIKRTIDSISNHLDRHPRDRMSQERLVKLKKLV